MPQSRRPSKNKVEKAVVDFLIKKLGQEPEFELHKDGDDGWAFWIRTDDTTSYVHHDMAIEWYGTGWKPGDEIDNDGEPAITEPDASPRP